MYSPSKPRIAYEGEILLKITFFAVYGVLGIKMTFEAKKYSKPSTLASVIS